MKELKDIDSFEQIEVHISEATLKAGKDDYPNLIKNAVIENVRYATLALRIHYNYKNIKFCLPL